jgi:predicted MFS family arabinose efflux permease
VLVFAGRFAAFGLAKNDYGLIPMSILTGFSNAGWDLVPIFCFIALAEPANFSLYMGVNTTLFGIRGIVGPWIGTLLYSSGALSIPQIFFGIAAIIALGAVLLVVFSRKVRTTGVSGIRPAP